MVHRLTIFVVLCLLVSGMLAARLQAQSSALNDPRIQQLYGEAKSAEEAGDLPAAAAKYEAMLKIAPRLGPAYNNLGSLYIKQREYGKAAAVLEKGIRVDPSIKVPASALLGMALFEERDYAKARPYLETIVRANPKDFDTQMVLVNDLTKLGDFEAAAQQLQRLTNERPSDQHVWYLLGKVYTQLAQQALGRVNAIDPNSVWAHEISGEIMENMKNYDGAIVEYKKAVEVAPRQPGGHYKLGDLYWSLSQWDNARAQFEAELANDPGNCMAQWKLGDILLQQSQRPEEALDDVNKALQMCPGLAEARLDRGKLLLRLHRNEEALTDLQAAEKTTPNEPTVHFALAQAYRATGNSERAQQEMQTFAKLDAEARAATAQQAQEVIKNKSQVQ